MLNNAKMRDDLYDILGIRIIATNRNCYTHDYYHHDDGHHNISVDKNYRYNNNDSDSNVESSDSSKRKKMIIDCGNSNTTILNYNHEINSFSNDTHDLISSNYQGCNEDIEYLGLLTIRSIVSNITEWNENIYRFKDYIKYPKRSGYQSLHMNIHHNYSNVNMEIQIRSDRMHEIAEHGPASHGYYKALMLPKDVE